jgi:hypothetical protein
MNSTQTTLGAVSAITPATRAHWVFAGELVRQLFDAHATPDLDPVVTNVETEESVSTVRVEVRGPETPRILTSVQAGEISGFVSFEGLEHRAEDDVGEYTELVVCIETAHVTLLDGSNGVDQYRLYLRLYAPEVKPLGAEPKTVSQLTLPIRR